MIKTEEEQLKQMRDRNEAIERDVQRYKERKKIEEEVCHSTPQLPMSSSFCR